MSRLRKNPISRPVPFVLDGEPMLGEQGESLAVAMWAAGVRTFSRSPKYHRPRGPFCFRGECEGCLVRVQGTPNTMACQVELSPELHVHTQNHLGSRDLDLLRATDWMFPAGMNHHEFLAGVPVAEDVMKAMARRIAGLGELPDAKPATTPRTACRVSMPVLIVGGGASGLRVGLELAERGVDCVLVEVAARPLPALAGLPRSVRATLQALHAKRAAPPASLDVWSRSLAAAVYATPRGLEVLVVGPEHTRVCAPTALVLATGSHDGLPVFEGNDLPGVLALRGACELLAHHVRPAANSLVVQLPGGTGLGRELADEHGFLFEEGRVLRAEGLGWLRAVEVLRVDGTRQRHEVDALILDAPRAPAFELAEQAGAVIEPAAPGFAPRLDAEGMARPGLFVVGAAAGEAPARQAEAVAPAVVDAVLRQLELSR